MTVYFDMDGVLADWVDGFNRKFSGVISYDDFNKLSSAERDVYRLEIDSDPDFYRSLKPNRSIVDLINFLLIVGYDVQILTSVGDSHSDLIAEQKMQWVRKHVNDSIKVNIVTSSKDKSLYAKSGDDILIDDREKALRPFADAGGVAIHYDMLVHSIDDLMDSLLK